MKKLPILPLLVLGYTGFVIADSETAQMYRNAMARQAEQNQEQSPNSNTNQESIPTQPMESENQTHNPLTVLYGSLNVRNNKN